MDTAPAGSALGHLRIVDFSRVLAGPFATMILGDLGAEVTKIERPDVGDDTRGWGPPFDEHGVATYYQSVNRNKDSVALDLTDPDDRELVLALALAADVVVENFRPGLMDELGLGYDRLRAGNEGVIFCSITGFGPDAPGMPGYDLLVQALGGLMSITGPTDGPPHKAGVALVDVLAGLFAAIGILTAIVHRDRTGVGQRVQVDLLSSLLAALVNQGSAFTCAGVVPTRMGNRHPSVAPYELLRCRDEGIVVAVGNDRQFTALCGVLGAPDLPADPRFATNAARVAARDALVEQLESRLATRPAAEWVQALTAARVPAGRVNSIAEAFALAERVGLNPIASIPRPEGGAVRLARNPIALSQTPPTYRLPPPPLPARNP
jgi:crotonobetainyl-CoA:carnitine CoA-transferase CaiB-like acyl-CoA transferase